MISEAQSKCSIYMMWEYKPTKNSIFYAKHWPRKRLNEANIAKGLAYMYFKAANWQVPNKSSRGGGLLGGSESSEKGSSQYSAVLRTRALNEGRSGHSSVPRPYIFHASNAVNFTFHWILEIKGTPESLPCKDLLSQITKSFIKNKRVKGHTMHPEGSAHWVLC
jgi:hypothetical protein